MRRARAKPIYALLAGAVLGLLVMPIALAGGSSGQQATASGVQKKLKKLNKKVKKANRAIAGLEQQVAALQGEQGGARPPSGLAGGDLTGTFPNPQIGSSAVGTAELQADSVTGPKIAADAVGTRELLGDSVTGLKIAADAVGTGELQADSVTGPKIAARAVGTSELDISSVTAGQIADGAVGANKLAEIMRFQRSVSIPPNGGVGEVGQNCPSGPVISGGAVFDFPSGDLTASYPLGGSWFAEGQNNGTAAQNLTVWVLCLPPFGL